MSLISDRARTITDAMRGDWHARFVYLMPRDRVLRIVSVPDHWDTEYLEFVDAESARLVGLFKPGTQPEVLARAIDRTWDEVPRGTSQVIDSTGAHRETGRAK